MINPETLIVGSGGTKGFLFIGALEVFNEKGILKNVKKYVGVSVGSIISLYMILGFTTLEILNKAIDLDLFKSTKFELNKIIEKKGLIKGFFLGISRLLKCHPFSKKSGFDPVE